MTHQSEFQPPPKKMDEAARELAACYARVFLGDDDGKRVLADLRRKFGLQRLVFRLHNGAYDALAAALVEGERRVMSDVESALLLGAPGQALAEPENPTKQRTKKSK